MTSENPIYLKALPEDNDMVSGRYPPQRIKNEPTDSVNLIIRSEDRIFGNDFDFQVDLLTSSVHIRKIQLAKCLLPLLPQINENNKSITVTHDTGTITFNLIDGYYSVQALANMMQAQFTAAWLSLNPLNSVTVNYDIDKRAITINDNNNANWYIHTDCPFNNYARNVVKFQTQAAGSATSQSFFSSTSLGMIYSRFIILSSSRLTEDQKSFSIVSNRGPTDIVAILDIASKYDNDQFAVSTSFPGTDVVLDTLDYAPRINILNRNKSLKIIDFQLTDEFGFPLNNINSNDYNFIYPTAMWFQCFL